MQSSNRDSVRKYSLKGTLIPPTVGYCPLYDINESRVSKTLRGNHCPRIIFERWRSLYNGTPLCITKLIKYSRLWLIVWLEPFRDWPWQRRRLSWTRMCASIDFSEIPWILERFQRPTLRPGPWSAWDICIPWTQCWQTSGPSKQASIRDIWKRTSCDWILLAY